MDNEEVCIECGGEAVGPCENCNAHICPDHESREYDDVYTCSNIEGCSKRIEENEHGSK